MRFILRHSLNSETDYIYNLLLKKEWFVKNGYNVRLPDNISLSDSKIIIRNKIINDFNKSDIILKKIKLQIIKKLTDNKPTMEKYFSYFQYNIPNSIYVNFTNYGPGGSYATPNTIITVLKKDCDWIIKTIIHETIHLIIEDSFIKKYNTSHWQKEYIVDKLCKNFILKNIISNYTMQSRSIKPPINTLKKLRIKAPLSVK